MEAEGLFRRPGSGGIGAGGQGCVVREDHRQIGLPPCGKADGGGWLSLLGRMGRGWWFAAGKQGYLPGGGPDPEGGLKKRLRLS